MEHFVCAIWYSLYVLCSSSQQSKVKTARETIGMATESLSILTLSLIFPLFRPFSPPLPLTPSSPLTTHIFLVFSYQAITLLLLIAENSSKFKRYTSVSPTLVKSRRHCQNYCLTTATKCILPAHRAHVDVHS